jgi:hypothetical protein
MVPYPLITFCSISYYCYFFRLKIRDHLKCAKKAMMRKKTLLQNPHVKRKKQNLSFRKFGAAAHLNAWVAPLCLCSHSSCLLLLASLLASCLGVSFIKANSGPLARPGESRQGCTRASLQSLTAEPDPDNVRSSTRPGAA